MNYIYQILNKVNGKSYIGSTSNLIRRKSQHFSTLRKNENGCTALQRAYNKYGKNSLEFVVLEEVSELDTLISREQYYIDTLNPEYNVRKVAHSNLGIKHSEEANIAKSKRQQKPVDQYSKDGKYIKTWESVKKAAEGVGGNKTVITACCRGIQKSCKGFRFSYSGQPLPSYSPKRNKYKTKEELHDNTFNTYKVTTPENEEILISNLKEYCNKNSLNYGCALLVAKNKQAHTKNYKFEIVKQKPRIQWCSDKKFKVLVANNTIKEIAKMFNASRGAVTKHMKKLKIIS